MKPELDRVKNDLETMQKAIGLTPSLGREWPRWLKRDRWLSFWWCLPGLMLIAGALAPLDQTKRILGLMTGQWIGLAVAGVLLGILFFWEKMLRGSVRPAEVTREYKRINAQALWFLVGFVAQIAFYFAWGAQHAIDGKPFMAGLWIVCGSSMLLLATVTKVWVYLGWALPMLAYGLCHPLLEQQGLWLGVVFIIAAFLSWAIQGAQSRIIAVQHVAD